MSTESCISRYELISLPGQDKGGANLIGSGDVKVKQGTKPVAFTETGLLFADGSTLEADSIVFA